MKYVYELLGSFFLIFTIGMVTLPPNNAGFLAPLAIGSILAVMVYAGAHISGGHYNPAVSFSVFMRGLLQLEDLFKYWLAQIIGAVLASSTVLFFKGKFVVEIVPVEMMRGFIAEALFTFALSFVVLNVATAKATKENCYFGLAIGATVIAGAYAVGPLSGGAFNPAVSVGLAMMNISTWTASLAFSAAQLIGGALAAITFKAAHNKE